MKLTDLIKFDNQIIEGKKQLFIASQNFSFKGLPIIKDSLVTNNGKLLRVNILKTIFALDSSHSDLYDLNGVLPLEENMYYNVDKKSRCPNEEVKLDSASIGYWHTNHFDKVGSITQYLNSRIQKNEPELDYNGINFSSIFYVFDIDNERLIEFISTKSIDIHFGDVVITLPKFIEIHRERNSYTLVPIAGMEYYGIFFSSGEGLTLNDDGVLEGYTGKGFKAERINIATNDSEIVDLPSHQYISISPNGSMIIRLFDPELQLRQDYRILKV